jgi:long-chain acyl-CoA synthetase
VREAGVFLDGETLHALLVADLDALGAALRADPQLWLRQEVLAPHNARVAPYKRIARATLVESELPRTRLGKLKRHQLKAIADASASAGETAAPDAAEVPALARIAAHLERQCQRPVHAASRLDGDLGLDSLGRVELAAFLEQAFGVEVPEARLAGIETVGELAAFVAGGEPGGAATGASWSEILSAGEPSAMPRSGLLHRAIVYGSRAAVRLCFRTRARGQERLPNGPCILAPNHQSFFDGLFVTAHMRPRTVLRTLFYAKAKHVDRRWLRYVAERSNVVVANADVGFRRSLQTLAAALRRGQNVMIFPEGTRSADGALGAFKESYAILARELGVPVVPVVIDGAHRALPTGHLLPRLLRKVSVTYLEPLRPRADEALAAFNERVHDAIAAQLALGRGQQARG